jgi:hypothetical protein
LITLVDSAAKAGEKKFYIEILAKHGVRKMREPGDKPTLKNFLEE